MKRTEIRSLKRGLHRAVRANQAELVADCARKLLQRSIDMGHHRLALIRMHNAAVLGVSLTSEQINYCKKVAIASSDREVQQLFAAALSFVSVPQAITRSL